MHIFQLAHMNARARWWVCVSAILSAVDTMLTVASGVLVGTLIARAVEPANRSEFLSHQLPSEYPYRLFWWLVLVVVVRALVSWTKTRLGDAAADSVVSTLRAQTLRHLVHQDPHRINRSYWHTILTHGLDSFRPYVTGFLPAAMASALSTPIALGAVAWLDVPSALWAGGTIPLIPFFMWLVGTLTQSRTERKLKDLSRLNDQLVDLVAGLPTLVAHGRQYDPEKEVRRLATTHKRSTMDVLKLAFLSTFVLEFIATLSVALVAVNIGFRLLGGHISLAKGLAILIIVPEVYAPLREVGARFHAAQDGVSALAAIRSELESSPPPRPTVPDQGHGPDSGLEVVLDHYSCEGRDGIHPHDLSAKARPGEITVLVGQNGSGKSTALMAVLGLGSGSGTAGVRNANGALSREEVWKRTAFLPQRPVITEGSIGDTSHLSLGQRQKESFRRLVPGKTLVVLDEPTAHLDEQSAKEMIHELRDLSAGGATVLVASHDPLVRCAADRVYDVGAIRDES